MDQYVSRLLAGRLLASAFSTKQDDGFNMINGELFIITKKIKYNHMPYALKKW